MNKRVHDRLLAAAQWDEDRCARYPVFVCTGPELRALAARVAAGDTFLDDMPDEPDAMPWSSVMAYLEDVKGIAVRGPAFKREGAQPMFIRTGPNTMVAFP